MLFSLFLLFPHWETPYLKQSVSSMFSFDVMNIFHITEQWPSRSSQPAVEKGYNMYVVFVKLMDRRQIFKSSGSEIEIHTLGHKLCPIYPILYIPTYRYVDFSPVKLYPRTSFFLCNFGHCSLAFLLLRFTTIILLSLFIPFLLSNTLSPCTRLFYKRLLCEVSLLVYS